MSDPDSIDMASDSFSCALILGYSRGVYNPRRPHLPNVGPMRAITVACATYHLRAAYRFWTTRTRTCPWDRVSHPPPDTLHHCASGRMCEDPLSPRRPTNL